jgi:peptidoglycan/xylan/chitin deacetylase (PgdA/CDA1 family)
LITGAAALSAAHLLGGRRIVSAEDLLIDMPATMGASPSRGESIQIMDPPEPPAGGLAGRFVTHVDVEGRMMALTFDDGPSPANTPIILRTLQRYGIKATFFLIGVNVHAFPDIARSIVDEGHEVGNHSVYHTPYRAAPLASQIGRNQDIIAGATGVRPEVHRAPGLTRGQIILNTCGNLGLYEAHTHMGTTDWLSPRRSASFLVEEFRRNHRNGAMPIYHDGGERRPTADAVEGIIQYGLSIGYTFVTAKELVRSGAPVPGTTFYTGGGVSIGSTPGDDGANADTDCEAHDDGFCQTCGYDPRAELVAMLSDDSLHLDRATRSRILDVIVDIDDHIRTS